MTLLSNSGFLAVAFMEASAAFLLLILYWLLLPGFPSRFFRYWLAGWVVYVAVEIARLVSLVRGSSSQTFSTVLSPIAAVLFFAAVLECTGRQRSLKYLLPVGAIVASGIVALGLEPRLQRSQAWADSLAVCFLYLLAGWFLWRSRARHRGAGWPLLAAALMLRGLHGLDRPDWSDQVAGLLRVSLHSLFGIAMGVAMAVLVLEASRARTEDISEKLRRLALITAEGMQSLRVHEALQGILQKLVESLGVSHGLVLLLDDPAQPEALVVSAMVGFGESYRTSCSRIPPSDPLVRQVLGQEKLTFAHTTSEDPTLRRWMDSERLTSIALVRLPGKEEPLGLLAIGSIEPRNFEAEEENFLTNVANLLGLTVQNMALMESASASQRQWVETFDSIDDLILVHAPDGRILRANRALASRLQTEPATLLGRTVREVLRQGDTAWTRCPYCEGAAGIAEKKDDSLGGYFLASNSAFHDSKGGRLGTIHVLKDLTSSRQAENKFRNLFENVQEGVFISTPEGRFVDFNNAFMRILGYDNAEEMLAVATPLPVYTDPTDRDRRSRLLDEYGRLADFEFQFRRRDGEIRTARESSFATRDDSGAIVDYQGFVFDITELKQAEMDIRRRNQELLALNAIAELLGQHHAVVEGLKGALLKVTELFALDTGSVYFLEENRRLLTRAASIGYRSEYSRQMGPVELAPALLDQIRRVHATLLSGAGTALPDALRELHRSEGVQVSQVVVLWSKDRIMGLLIVGCREMRQFSTAELNLLSAVGNQIATAIDKSLLLEKTREAYESLRHTQAQLLQSEKMAAVGQLISGVAHELNNPLTAILGYSQLLKSEELAGPRGMDYLAKLHKQAQRTHHIVQSLLSFARQHKPQRASVQIHQILEDTLVLREYDLKVSKIRVHREFDTRVPATGADFQQLQQVFLNIINNAVDAIQEKGEPGDIWIRTESDGHRLRVEIADSGPGVQNPHRIFDPFYTTKPVGKGTGLGLSICYGIIKEHGGEIEVRNAPPRGAVFTVTLPLLVVSPEMPGEKNAPAQPKTTGKVLLVDSEETVLHLEEEVLLAAGASVWLARNSAEAIAILKREQIDGIVYDMNTPGEMSSDAFCRWIEENHPELAGRIVFTSGAADNDPSQFRRRPGCQVVAKPFRIEEFSTAVQNVLNAPVPSASKP